MSWSVRLSATPKLGIARYRSLTEDDRGTVIRVLFLRVYIPRSRLRIAR